MNRRKRFLAAVLTLCALAAQLVPAAMASSGAPPDSGNAAPAGQNGYVSLHKYVSTTDKEDVFRVQLQVQGVLRPKPLLVTFVLDYSSSMREQPNTNHVEDRYFRWTGEGLRHAMEVLADPDQNPAYDHTYINIISYGRTPTSSITPPMSNIELSAASMTEVWVDDQPGQPLTTTLPPVTGWWPAYQGYPAWTDDSYGFDAYMAGYNTGTWSGFTNNVPVRNIAPTTPLPASVTPPVSSWPVWSSYNPALVDTSAKWTQQRDGSAWPTSNTASSVNTAVDKPFVKLVDGTGQIQRKALGPALLFEHSIYQYANFDPYKVSTNPVTFWHGPINAPRPVRVTSTPVGTGSTTRLNTSTWMGAGLHRAYYNLDDIRNNPPDADYSDFDDYNNFVMIMTDGSDSDGFEFNANSGARQFPAAHWPIASAQGFATALKAPSKYQVNVAYDDNPAYPTLTLHGLNAQVWSLLLNSNASVYRSNWDQAYYNWPAVEANMLGVDPTRTELTTYGWPYGRAPRNTTLTGVAYATTADEGRGLAEMNLVSLAVPLKIDDSLPSGAVLNPGMNSTANTRMLGDWLNFYAGDPAYAAAGVTGQYREVAAGGQPNSALPDQVALVSDPGDREAYTPYFPCQNRGDVLNAFDSFAVAAGAFGAAPYVMDKLGAMYDIYQMPGEALLALEGDGAGTAEADNGLIDWRIDEIKDGELLTLTYYVKLKDGAQSGLSYATNEYAYISYNYTDENGISQDVTKHFPIPYASPEGEVKNEEAPQDISPPPAETGKTPPSFALPLSEVYDQKMDVESIRIGEDESGRTKVMISVENGATMRYQWQFKNAAGQWEDIFGANGSHYTMGRQFLQGKTYELRCKITNLAGRIAYSDSVEVTVEGEGKGNAALQVKDGEEGPAIQGETVMDGGEEVAVANTATRGQIVAVLAGLLLCAGFIYALIFVRHRIYG